MEPVRPASRGGSSFLLGFPAICSPVTTESRRKVLPGALEEIPIFPAEMGLSRPWTALPGLAWRRLPAPGLGDPVRGLSPALLGSIIHAAVQLASLPGQLVPQCRMRVVNDRHDCPGDDFRSGASSAQDLAVG